MKHKIKNIKEDSTIRMTYNYNIFESVRGNRIINEPHVKKRIKSMKEQYIPVPIIVNQKRGGGSYQLIDGQHRLAAARFLNLPVYFIIKQGLALKDIQRLNANTKNWNLDDFMNGYCELGYEEYLRYKKFKEKWGFGHSETWALLSNTCSASHGANEDFRDGNFKVRNYEQAIYNAQVISDLQRYYEGYKRSNFVMAMLQLLSNKKYSHKRFLNKIDYQSTKLVDCSRTEDYLLLLQKIYNFKTTKSLKLRFVDF